MKVWWEYGSKFGEDESVRVYYYIFFNNRYFSTYIIKNIKNRKRWKPERMITIKNLKFAPISWNLYRLMSSFEIEDDKIKFFYA